MVSLAERHPAHPSTGQAPVEGGLRGHGWWRRFEFGPLLSGATALFLAAVAIMLMEAFCRAFLDTSFFWAEESVRYLMVWAFFLTLGVAGTEGHHIRTDLLVDRFGPRGRQIADVLASLVGTAFSGLLFFASIPQVHRYYTMGMRTESNLDLPMWLLFLIMPIGALLYLSYYLRALWCALRGGMPFAAGHMTDPAS